MTKKERKMPKKENLTEEYLYAVLDALPDSMDGDEIAALTMVIWLRYMDDDMPTLMEHLTRSVYTCGNYFGLTDSIVSQGLIATAKMRMDDDLPSGRMQ